jgi:hypothetical protein
MVIRPWYILELQPVSAAQQLEPAQLHGNSMLLPMEYALLTSGLALCGWQHILVACFGRQQLWAALG